MRKKGFRYGYVSHIIPIAHKPIRFRGGAGWRALLMRSIGSKWVVPTRGSKLTTDT